MTVDDLRSEIDDLDAQIVRLLNRRAELATEIGKLKAASNHAAYAPEREMAVIRKALRNSPGHIFPEALEAVYREIISACRALERRPRVAFLGPEGTFTHQGAEAKFGSAAEFISVKTIRSVFTAVSRGEADYGVVPIENSTEGGIGETMDALIDTSLAVCGEIPIPVHHNLMARCKLQEVRRIYSKLQVFEQCGEWLAGNLPNVETVETGSTTRAAALAREQPDAAAIAHEEAARIYDLTILARNIEDDPRNATRFLVLAEHYARPTGDDRTSLICFIKDEVGALLRILEHFRDHGLNLSFIESRPSRRKMWDYCFFIDLAGHVEEPPVAAAIEEVRGECKDVKLLGSYPASR